LLNWTGTPTALMLKESIPTVLEKEKPVPPPQQPLNEVF
jgi:hypothetical protein